ncbi:MAG: hypothetical protein ABSF32_02305 [Ignavibacteria bacterium]|jgi:hypothetical protein
MSLYVGVNAEFPSIDRDQKDKIFVRLQEKKWVIIKNFGREFSSLWFARFKDDVDFDAAIELTEKEFKSCSDPYTVPKLIIHAGHTKPKIIA